LKTTGKELDTAKPKLKPWPSKGLRHSFASNHLAHFHDAARLALELGHTDQEPLFRHYRELVTPESSQVVGDPSDSTGGAQRVSDSFFQVAGFCPSSLPETSPAKN
jgi:hypothetical protein